jgi:hypothetical protein
LDKEQNLDQKVDSVINKLKWDSYLLNNITLLSVGSLFGESTYRYDLMDNVLKACGDMYDNHKLALQHHPLHLQNDSE